MHRLIKAMALIVSACGLLYAQVPQWQNLYPAYSGMAFGGGKFVAVSEDGVIKTSEGSGEWSQAFSPGGVGLLSAAYGDGEFLIPRVGTSLMRSENAHDWDIIPTAMSTQCRHLIFGENIWERYVGVGGGNVTFYYHYEDGWVTPTAVANLSRVAFGANVFTAIGTGGIASSSDGETWAMRNASASGGAVAFGDGGFVALSSAGTTVYTSANGAAWTSEPSNAPAGMADMAFGDGKFVAVGENGKAAVSSDGGANWTESTLNANDNFIAVKFGNGIFKALGVRGSIYTSTDGANWSSQAAGRFAISYKQIAYDGVGTFMAVGDSGVSVSQDGRNWSNSAGAPKNLQGVAFGAGKFVVVGDSGAIFVSENGDSWTDHSRDDRGMMFTAVAYGNSTFVVVGRSSGAAAGAGVITSVDGEVWVDRTGPNMTPQWQGSYPVSLTFGHDRFLAGGSGNNWVVRSSENGEFWAPVQAPADGSNYRIASITHSDGRYVALGVPTGGAANVIFSSADGTSWTKMQPPAGVRAATFAKGFYVAVADSGNIHASTDGNQWILQKKATNRNLQTIYALIYDHTGIPNHFFFAAGAAGVMLYSSENPDMVSIRHTSAASRRTSAGARSISMENTRRAPMITLSFTPENPGTISVYSLTGKQIYKARISAGQRTLRLPERVLSNGTVIVRYAGDGTVIARRFQLVK